MGSLKRLGVTFALAAYVGLYLLIGLAYGATRPECCDSTKPCFLYTCNGSGTCVTAANKNSYYVCDTGCTSTPPCTNGLTSTCSGFVSTAANCSTTAGTCSVGHNSCFAQIL